MSEPFVGEIRIVGFDFAPRGWASCDGQLLPISQNTALFSLLGTMYGGDGRTTFALPNLEGSAPVSFGSNGQSAYDQGQSGGGETVTLDTPRMPPHNHRMTISRQPATARQPGQQMFAVATGVGFYGNNTDPTTTLNPDALSNSGGSQPHNNMMPFLTMRFIIALTGVFPSRP